MKAFILNHGITFGVAKNQHFSHGHCRRRAVSFTLTEWWRMREGGPLAKNQPEPVTGPWVYTETVYLFILLAKYVYLFNLWLNIIEILTFFYLFIKLITFWQILFMNLQAHLYVGYLDIKKVWSARLRTTYFL